MVLLFLNTLAGSRSVPALLHAVTSVRSSCPAPMSKARSTRRTSPLMPDWSWKAFRAARDLGLHRSGAQAVLPLGRAGVHDQATVREYCCERNGKSARLDKPGVETVCGITSHTPEIADAEAFLGFNRAHWSCERVHRVFDDAATWNDKCRPAPQRAWPGEPQLPPKAGDRPRPRARQVGRADDQGAIPEPTLRSRPTPAQPEHAATREVRRVALQSAAPDQVDRTCLAAPDRQIGVPGITHRAGEAGPKSRYCRRNCRIRSRMNCVAGKRPRQGPRRKDQPWQ